MVLLLVACEEFSFPPVTSTSLPPTATAAIPTPTATLTPGQQAEVEEILTLMDSWFGVSCGGSWICHTIDDPIHDEISLARLSSTEYLAIRDLIEMNYDPTETFGVSDDRLMIRCMTETTEVWVQWENRLGDTDPVITHRIDQISPQTKTWRISTSGDGTFYSEHQSEAIDFMESLLAAESLVVRALPEGAEPRTITFDLDGISEAISDVRARCSW
jgi:hypothetical protein